MTSYIDTEILRQLLGNTSDANVTAEALTAAELFVNGTIDAKIGGAIPSGTAEFNSASGIAYMLGKVFAQFGTETEAVRSLDFKIAMDLLTNLYTSMTASGMLNTILATDKATIDDTAPDQEYLTAPLNPNGIIILGSKAKTVGAISNRTGLDAITETP
jgi:hypothetical protein